MFVRVRILSTACVSRRHTSRSPGTWAIPRQVSEIRDGWSSIVNRLQSPNLKSSKLHLSLYHNPCHSSKLFPKIESFPIIREFNLSRSFEVSKANRQLQWTGARCWCDEVGLRGWANWSRGDFYNNLAWTTSYWQGLRTRHRQRRLRGRRSQQAAATSDRVKYCAWRFTSPFLTVCSDRVETRGAWLSKRRVNYLEMNSFETANSQVPPPPLARHVLIGCWNWDPDDTHFLFVEGAHGS